MIRPLVINDAFRAECRRLREFAEDPKNWYLFGEADWVPGDRPEYVLRTGAGYRVVFTITHAPQFRPEPFRHMTISIPGEGYPHSDVVLIMAHQLGFTGAEVDGDVVTRPGRWNVGVDEDEGCVVVQQPYEVTQ